jgi:hypothetical protein
VQPIPILGQDDDRLVKAVMGHYDVPAYVRRARQVQDVLEELLACCRGKRTEWLGMVRIRLATLHALAGDWTALRPYLADDRQCEIFTELFRELAPELRAPVGATTSPRLLRRSLHEVCESLERFNRRWRKFLAQVNLSFVNEARDGYNRYYVLEKECAVRSAVAARQGFLRLEPITREQIATWLPELPVPQRTE